MNQTEKLVIGIALGVMIAVPGGIYLMGVRPAESDLTRLRKQFDAVMRDRDSTDRLLSLRQQEWQKVVTEVERLRLFDLRKEERYEAVMVNRTNLGLIALSEIFEKNGIAIDALEPQASEYKSVTINNAPPAGVARRRYVLMARGPYQSVLKVYDAFKTLPPTLEISGYEVAYLDTVGQRASVSLKLEMAFNYLLTPEQLAQVQAAEQSSDSAPVTPVSWHPAQAVRLVLDWLMPPAWAQAASPEKLYTIPVRKTPSLGRSEPFLPLAPEATMSAISQTSPAAPFQVALVGVLLGGDGLPGAIVSTNGQRIRVRPGSVLPNGGEVLAIGDGFVLIRHSGAIRRIGLSRDPSPQGEASEPPDVPVPSIPPIPSGD